MQEQRLVRECPLATALTILNDDELGHEARLEPWGRAVARVEPTTNRSAPRRALQPGGALQMRCCIGWHDTMPDVGLQCVSGRSHSRSRAGVHAANSLAREALSRLKFRSDISTRLMALGPATVLAVAGSIAAYAGARPGTSRRDSPSRAGRAATA